MANEPESHHWPNNAIIVSNRYCVVISRMFRKINTEHVAFFYGMV